MAFNFFGLIVYLISAGFLYLFVAIGASIVGLRFHPWVNKAFFLLVLAGAFFSFTTGYSGPKFTLEGESGYSVETPSEVKDLRESPMTDEERLEYNQKLYKSNEP